jgi:hypothetical protein
MSSDAKLILKRPGRLERWEEQERGDYDLDRLGEEFRRRLYSNRGRELIGSEQRRRGDRDGELRE